MSLIQEALQKAAKVNAPDALDQIPPPFTPPSAPQKKMTAEKKVSKPAFKFENPLSRLKDVKIPRIPSRILMAALVTAAGAWLIFCITWFPKKQASAPVPARVMAAGLSSAYQPAPPASAFRLSGITEQKTGNLALINDQVVGVGDRLKEKAFVKEIHSKTVVLDLNGREITLKI